MPAAPTTPSSTRAPRDAIDDDVMPSDLYPAEQWLNAWRAWQLAGDGAGSARRRWCKGRDWVRPTLREHVPEAFRDSFVRANPVNQQLARAAARAGLPGAMEPG